MAERGMARRQYQQAYYQSRKEELQKRHREYYWAHREQVLAKYREGCGKAVKNKNEMFPRCPYCDDEMQYVVLDAASLPDVRFRISAKGGRK